MKKFPMALNEGFLYERFMDVFNVISSNLDLTKEENNYIEKEYLKYLVKDIKCKEEIADIFEEISELLTLYCLYQRYTDFTEIFNEIQDLIEKKLPKRPKEPKEPKEPKFPKNTIGKRKEEF